MKLRVEYEWVIEWTNPETENIEDCSYWDELDWDGAMRCLSQWCLAHSPDEIAFGLCRHLIEDHDDGEPEEAERKYAYFEGDQINPDFEEGGKVPQRFLKKTIEVLL